MKNLFFFFLILISVAVSSCGDDPEPAPTGGFTFAAKNGDLRAPAEISFTPSDDISGATYAWDFGDGSTSTEKSPKKVYLTGGSKLVSLTVTNAGNAKTETKTITLDAAYTKVTVSGVKINAYMLSYPDGTGWDIATTGTDYVRGAPDMYVIARFAGVSSDALYSTIKVNSSPSSPPNWTNPYSTGGLSAGAHSGDNLGKVLTIYLRDADEASSLWSSAYESMGNVTVKFSDLMTIDNKYPATVDLQGSGSSASNALKMQLTLKWE